MGFLFSFVSCKPFLYLIGSLCVSSVFILLHFIVKGEINFK